jgi:hypothetical protein
LNKVHFWPLKFHINTPDQSHGKLVALLGKLTWFRTQVMHLAIEFTFAPSNSNRRNRSREVDLSGETPLPPTTPAKSLSLPHRPLQRREGVGTLVLRHRSIVRVGLVYSWGVASMEETTPRWNNLPSLFLHLGAASSGGIEVRWPGHLADLRIRRDSCLVVDGRRSRGRWSCRQPLLCLLSCSWAHG